HASDAEVRILPPQPASPSLTHTESGRARNAAKWRHFAHKGWSRCAETGDRSGISAHCLRGRHFGVSFLGAPEPGSPLGKIREFLSLPDCAVEVLIHAWWHGLVVLISNVFAYHLRIQEAVTANAAMPLVARENVWTPLLFGSSLGSGILIISRGRVLGSQLPIAFVAARVAPPA